MHQFQLEVTKRMTSGFSVQGHYQWTRSLDNVELTGQTNWHFPSLDYGNTSYIRRHQVVANYLYEMPFGRGKKWLAHTRRLVEVSSAAGRFPASRPTPPAFHTPSTSWFPPTTSGGREGAPILYRECRSISIRPPATTSRRASPVQSGRVCRPQAMDLWELLTQWLLRTRHVHVQCERFKSFRVRSVNPRDCSFAATSLTCRITSTLGIR